VEESFDHIDVTQAALSDGRGESGIRTETGIRIDFQDVNLASIINAHINSRTISEHKEPETIKRRGRQFLIQFRRKAREDPG
jgi:hypothetical protein